MGIVIAIIYTIIGAMFQIISGIFGIIVDFWPVFAGILLLCMVVGMFETIAEFLPALAWMVLLCIVGIILFKLPWGVLGNIIIQIVYLGFVSIVLALVGGFFSNKLKQFKLRSGGVLILFSFILVKLSAGPFLPNPILFNLALALSIGTFAWGIFKLKFIKQNIGFTQEVDKNIMLYYLGMFVGLECMILYLFGFHDNAFGITLYLGLGLAIFSLYMHLKSYRDIQTYLNINGYCTRELIVKNLQIEKNYDFLKYDFLKQTFLKIKQKIDKNEEEKEAFVDQVLSKMKQNKLIIELGSKEPVFIVSSIYDEVLTKLKKEMEYNEIILSISKDFNVNVPKNIIDIIFDNSILARRIKRNKINSEFMLLRYTIQEHPILTAGKDFQILYCNLMNYILQDLMQSSSTAIAALMQRYAEELNLKDEDKVLLNSTSVQKSLDKICSNEFYSKGLNFSFKNYKFLLLLEAFYFRSVYKNKLEYELLENYCQQLHIKGKTKNEVLGLIESFLLQPDDIDMALSQCLDKNLLSAGIYLQANLKKNYMYDGLPKYNVAVCATMSSGKSTFVNALLGYDYIPSRNEACTAKITTIADNDYLDSILGGVVQKNGEVFFGENVSKEMLETWNNDNKVERVLLETDLKGIKSEKGVLVVHDTPGTNYSQDQEHHNQTMTFLKDNEINLIIYLVNAEHVSTMDNRILLQQIKAEVIEKQSTQMIFLVNKLDSFDSEKQDDVVACLEGVKKELVEIGYKKPIILPIVANAARLFKMALNGHGTRWTKREGSEFRNLYELFIEERFDLFELSRKIIPVKPMEFKGEKDSLLIDNKEYSRVTILEALQRTGITVVEELLDREINFGGAFE